MSHLLCVHHHNKLIFFASCISKEKNCKGPFMVVISSTTVPYQSVDVPLMDKEQEQKILFS